MEGLIAQHCAKGGLLGYAIEPVVVDPASGWPVCAEKARELITVQEVDVTFGINATLGHAGWSNVVAHVKALGAEGKNVGVISAINVDAIERDANETDPGLEGTERAA